VKTDSVVSAMLERMKPEDDAIKLFIGQLPRSMTEDEVRKVMEEHGTIYQLSIIKDHATGESKGI